jgi:hypothetical protein
MRNRVDLPAPFGPMTPTMAPGGHGEAQILDQQLVAHVLFQAGDLDHLVAQTFAVGDDDLRGGGAFADGLAGHLVIAR